MNQEAMRRKVQVMDPGFTVVLEKRDKLARDIALVEREFSHKRIRVEQQMAQLRKELREADDEAKQKIVRTKAQLSDDIQRVDAAWNAASSELKTKRQQRASLGRSISQLRKTLGNTKAPLSEAEQHRTARELEELSQAAARIDSELAALRSHLTLLKMKRLLLRL